MSKNIKREKGRGGVLKGAAYGILTMLLLMSALAIAVSKNAALSESSAAAVTAINIISAAVCGACAAYGRKNKRLLVALGAGTILAAIPIITGEILNLDNISICAICETVIISLVGSAVGSLLNLCNSNKKLRNKSSR